MSVVITVLSLIVALSIMIFVHELGHYLAAKRAKIVVKEFGFGYPPRVWTFWRGEGKVVLDGEEIVVPRKFERPDELAVRSRVHYETATDEKGRKVLTHIETVDPESPEAIEATPVEFWDAGTIYSVNAIPFGGFTLMLGEEDPTFPGSFASKGKLTRIWVLAAGAGMNLLTAIVFFILTLMIGAPAIADPENAVVASISPGSPAEAVGLQVGDVVLKADDTDILQITDLLDFTRAHLGEPVALTIERDGQLMTIEVVPRTEWPADDGPIGMGLSPRTTIKHYPWYEALWGGVKETVSMAVLIFTVPIQIIRGLIPAELARPVGPVGVGQLVGGAVEYTLKTGWWFPVMQMLGSLSVALALTNLLPLPGLDGGRILFIIVEGIRGKRIDPAKEGLVHLIGMLLLVALMVLITWQDIVHPVPTLDWSSFF
jgi:regulator of sigma E protease